MLIRVASKRGEGESRSHYWIRSPKDILLGRIGRAYLYHGQLFLSFFFGCADVFRLCPIGSWYRRNITVVVRTKGSKGYLALALEKKMIQGELILLKYLCYQKSSVRSTLSLSACYAALL